MELMITVAIVGILAAIAYPSYLSYMERSNRTDATTTMMNDAQILQRCYSQTYDYTQCISTFTPAPAGVTQVSATSTSPGGYYSLSVTTPAANQYTITASPAKSPQTSDSACTQLTLDNTGTQGSSGTASHQTCWGSN
jgi:type IV pilus assembly protein PilE